MIRVNGDPIEQAVTKPAAKTVTKPKIVTIARKGGRPKIYATDADRQRAYRERKAKRAAP